MRWFGWFRGAFQGGALTNPDEGPQKSGPPGGRTEANIVVTDERAMQISVFFACVRLLVQTGASLPLAYFTRTTEGRDPLDIDHYLWTLLNFTPNNFMTAKEFRQAMWTQRVMWGNAYARIKWMGKRPVSLTPLKPEFMTVGRGETGLVYSYSTTKGVIEYQQREIMHLKGFSTDGIIGVSAIAYARQSLGLSISADRSAAKAVNQQANSILEVAEWPTEEQRAELRQLYGGTESSAVYGADGQMMIVVGGMKYKVTSVSPDDLQLLESRQFQIPEICRYFGVPAVMVDGAAGATAAWPASYEQQVLAFLTFGLKPYLDEWEDVIPDSLLLGGEKRSVIVRHNIEGLLRTDSKGRAEFLSKMVQNGLMTRNEARRKENLPRIEGADELTVQVNMTNLEDLPQVSNGNATE